MKPTCSTCQYWRSDEDGEIGLCTWARPNAERESDDWCVLHIPQDMPNFSRIPANELPILDLYAMDQDSDTWLACVTGNLSMLQTGGYATRIVEGEQVRFEFWWSRTPVTLYQN